MVRRDFDRQKLQIVGLRSDGLDARAAPAARARPAHGPTTHFATRPLPPVRREQEVGAGLRCTPAGVHLGILPRL